MNQTLSLSYTRWLDPSIDDPAVLVSMLRAVPDAALEGYRVSTLVNAEKNDSPECIRRADAPLRPCGTAAVKSKRL